jgi:dephospho-CoA kinase
MMDSKPTTPFKVALTGGIGSGKSAAGSGFEKLGIPVIDSDAIAHQITAPNGLAIPAITQTFGADYLTAEGALDRAKMRYLVFSDPHALKLLEAITHPLIKSISEEKASQALKTNPAYIIFMIPLLFESQGWQGRFQKIVVVDCSIDHQIQRVILRNNLQQEDIEKIIATQAPRAVRLQYADYVLNNNGTLDELQEQVNAIHTKIVRESDLSRGL